MSVEKINHFGKDASREAGSEEARKQAAVEKGLSEDASWDEIREV